MGPIYHPINAHPDGTKRDLGWDPITMTSTSDGTHRVENPTELRTAGARLWPRKATRLVP